jgi:hypothetical protein
MRFPLCSAAIIHRVGAEQREIVSQAHCRRGHEYMVDESRYRLRILRGHLSLRRLEMVENV